MLMHEGPESPGPEVALDVATGESRLVGSCDLVTYSVEERRCPWFAACEVARHVELVLDDRRRCTVVTSRSVERVRHKPTLRVRPGDT